MGTKSTIILFNRANSWLQNTIFQHSHHHLLCIFTSNVQIPAHCTQKSAWLSGVWPVFHVAVTAAEMHHPPPHCANIHWWVSINVQQASLYASVCNFFRMKEFNFTLNFASYALLCQMLFWQSDPLLSFVTWQQNIMECWWEVPTSTAIPPTSASDNVL